MWTIIVSTTITLQTVETSCPNENVVHARVSSPLKHKIKKNKNTNKNINIFEGLPYLYNTTTI